MTVVITCGCGCPSVDFAIGGKEPEPESGMELFGDYFYGTDDDLCCAFVFARDGQLAGIEFYPLAADEVPAKIPLPASEYVVNQSEVVSIRNQRQLLP